MVGHFAVGAVDAAAAGSGGVAAVAEGPAQFCVRGPGQLPGACCRERSPDARRSPVQTLVLKSVQTLALASCCHKFRIQRSVAGC